MLKKLFRTKFHLRFTINPLIRLISCRMKNKKMLNSSEREAPVIVSLTSYKERFAELDIALYSLFNQSFKPDRIILWLSDEYTLNSLPYSVSRFVKNGLEIRFVKDIRSYTKIIYALKEFSGAIIVTADDDIYYPKSWLQKLYYPYLANPEDIHVHRAHRVEIGKPYESWEKHVKEESARFDNFLTGVGGALYPSGCFSAEVFREDVFLKNAPYADDIWLWVMALLNNRKIRVVKNHIKTLTCVNIFRQIFNNSKSLYEYNSSGGNDEQLANLMKLYGRNILPKLQK